jgi:hypothetical protein
MKKMRVVFWRAVIITGEFIRDCWMLITHPNQAIFR